MILYIYTQSGEISGGVTLGKAGGPTELKVKMEPGKCVTAG